jgi:hypothetical protein
LATEDAYNPFPYAKHLSQTRRSSTPVYIAPTDWVPRNPTPEYLEWNGKRRRMSALQSAVERSRVGMATLRVAA